MRRIPGISIRKDVCGGEPCVKGTRVPTRIIRVLFLSGEDVQDLTTYFCRKLSVLQVETALRFELINRRGWR